VKLLRTRQRSAITLEERVRLDQVLMQTDWDATSCTHPLVERAGFGKQDFIRLHQGTLHHLTLTQAQRIFQFTIGSSSSVSAISVRPCCAKATST